MGCTRYPEEVIILDSYAGDYVFGTEEGVFALRTIPCICIASINDYFTTNICCLSFDVLTHFSRRYCFAVVRPINADSNGES